MNSVSSARDRAGVTTDDVNVRMLNAQLEIAAEGR